MTNPHEVIIRPYAPRDRDAVRHLCCETADRGEPLERFFGDREAFADLVTGYYTDHEPQSVWVAEHAGQVIGYLTGCLDTRRHSRILATRVVPTALLRAVYRGTLLSAQTWRLLWAGILTWGHGVLHMASADARQRPPQNMASPPRTLAEPVAGGFGGHVSLKDYPAHFHVDIQRGFRRQQVGRRLVERFFEHAHAAGIRGIHIAVRADNPSSRRFFERMGFTELARCSVTFPQGASYEVHDTIVYGKRLPSR